MKTNQITFKVAKLDDAAAKAIGIAVTSDTAPAKEIGMTRDQLADLGFEGKLGQTLVLPNGKKQLTIVVGIGEVAKANADAMRTAAAALARASAKVASLSTSLATAGRGDRAAIAQAVTEGFILATHRY
ncbi:MAG: M17 family peptidase N-terminal domain-containing protein, partial [Ilumatobacteraceae bacterium]